MGVNECPYVSVIFRTTFDAAGRAKGGDERVPPLHIAGAFEEFHILWVRTRPTTLNEGNAEFIQFLCNPDLSC
jgi:hypothetical protein